MRRRKNDNPSLLDVIAAKEAAIKQVNANADRDWKDMALVCLFNVARSQETLTADDLRERMIAEASTLTDFPETHDLRATGPIMLKGKAEGWIRGTDRQRVGRFVSSHGRPQQVWISLIYEKAEPTYVREPLDRSAYGTNNSTPTAAR